MQIVLDAVDPHVLFCFHCTAQDGVFRQPGREPEDFGKYRRAGTIFVAVSIEAVPATRYSYDLLSSRPHHIRPRPRNNVRRGRYHPFDVAISGDVEVGPTLWLPWAFLHFMHTPHFGPLDLVHNASHRGDGAQWLRRDPSSWAARRLRDPSRRRGRQEVRALLAQKSRFALYLYSNCWAHHRSEFFKRLSRYRFVHSPGKCDHNFNDTDVTPQFARGHHLNSFVFDDRIELLPKYKFVFAFNNALTQASTAVNEKIPNTWLGGAVAIYFGSLPNIAGSYFNSRAFVHVHTEKDFDAKIELIQYLDGNDTAYAEMLAEPLLLDRPRFPFEDDHADYDLMMKWPCGTLPPHALDNAVSDQSALFGKTWRLDEVNRTMFAPSLYEFISDVVDCDV